MSASSGRSGLRASTSGVDAPQQEKNHHPFIVFSDASPIALAYRVAKEGYFNPLGEFDVKTPCFSSKKDFLRDVGLLNTTAFASLSHCLVGEGCNYARVAALSKEEVQVPSYTGNPLVAVDNIADILKNMYICLEIPRFMEDGTFINLLAGIRALHLSPRPMGDDFCVLDFFSIRKTEEELARDYKEGLCYQRLFSALENNLFYDRTPPESSNSNYVYLRIDSIALDTLESTCASKRISPEIHINHDCLVEIDGARYITVVYNVFLNFVLFPWFRTFLNNASRNNGDTL